MFRSSKKKQATPKIGEINIIIGALERFISHAEKDDWDEGSAWDYDDHMSIKFDNQRAEALRQLCWQVSDAFPGEGAVAHSLAGIDVLKVILAGLKKERGPQIPTSVVDDVLGRIREERDQQNLGTNE